MQRVAQQKAQAKRLAMRNKKTMERALQGDFVRRQAGAPAKKQLTKASSPNLSTSQRPKAERKKKSSGLPAKKANATHGTRLRNKNNRRPTATAGPVNTTTMKRLTSWPGCTPAAKSSALTPGTSSPSVAVFTASPSSSRR